MQKNTESLRKLKRRVSKLRSQIARDNGLCDNEVMCIDGYFEDMISDIRFFIDEKEEAFFEENKQKTDFEEHNTLNKAQQGIE